MTRPNENDPEVGLMRMLREALRAGLAPGADDEAFAMARASAQIIGLAQLDAALDALDGHRARPLGGPALELVEFLDRLLAENDLPAFRAAEADLGSRAEAIRGWRALEDVDDSDPMASLPPLGDAVDPDEPDVVELPPDGALTVEEALVDLPLSGDAATARATRTVLVAPVASGLRAALEFLVRDADRPRPFRLRAEDSVLEVQCENVSPGALEAAHVVIAEAGGLLVPVGEVSARPVPGAWVVRVAAWSPRPVHLMLEQGDLRLALPWHSVLRVSLVPTIEIEMRGGSLNTPVLPSLAPLHESTGERPVVAIAHGATRGLLVADRLVWRLGTEPCAPEGPSPSPLLRDCVRSVEGEPYWVAEPGRLLVSLPVPPFPGQRPPRDAVPATPGVPAAPPRRAPETLEPAWLSTEDVEPLALTTLDVEPITAPRVEAPAAPAAIAAEPIEPSPMPEPDAPAPEPLEPAPADAAVAMEPEAIAPAAEAPAPAAASGDATPADATPNDATPDDSERRIPRWIERFGATGGDGAVEPEGPRGPAAGAPAALVVEDSIAARHFLARLLERRGIAVHAVDTAAAARAALASRRWSLVCVDVDLPDAPAAGLVSEFHAALDPEEIAVVALVRDDEDADRAAAGGVRRHLRKPFDFDAVDQLLSRLGLLGESRS